jgi:hypothetical protein
MSTSRDSTAQFITAMKLRELNRQRTKLRETYRELAEKSAALQRPESRLKTLYEGLRQISFAGQPLHPDVVNLEMLFFEDDAGTLSPDVRAMWVKRLEEELATGRLRSEFVYLFGALLEEWARGGPADALLLEEGRIAKSRLLQDAISAPGKNKHMDLIDPVSVRPWLS